MELNRFTYATSYAVTVKDYKKRKTVNVPAIAFPYCDMHGNPIDYTVYRLNVTDNQPLPKYINPAGKQQRYYWNAVIAYQTPLQDTLYITEGQKKAISLASHGVYCIANSGLNVVSQSVKELSGEYVRTVDYAPKQELCEFCENREFKNICFIIDNDFNAHKNHARHVNFFASLKALKVVCDKLGKTAYVCVLNPNVYKAKAFDDFFAVCTLSEKQEALQGLNSLTSNQLVTVYNLNQYNDNDLYYITNHNNIIEIPLNEPYITSDAKCLQLIDYHLANRQLIQLTAPTGTGKSSFILEYVKTQKGRFVIVFPTNSILESLEKQLLSTSYCKVNYSNTKEERELLSFYINEAQVVITTYASFHKISKAINSDYTVFIDEFHKCLLSTIDYSFWQSYYETKHKAGKLITLTASPLNEFAMKEGFTTLNLVNQSVKPNLTLVNCKRIKASLFDYIDGLSTSPNTIHQIYCDNKETLNELASHYQDVFDVQLWVSGCQSEGYYKHWLNTGFVTTNQNKATLMLCTCFVAEGVSFLNTNVASIAVFGESCPQNVYQCLNRFRNATNCKRFAFLSLREKYNNPLFFKYLRVLTDKISSNMLGYGIDASPCIGSRSDIIDSNGYVNWYRLCANYNRLLSPLMFLNKYYCVSLCANETTRELPKKDTNARKQARSEAINIIDNQGVNEAKSIIAAQSKCYGLIKDIKDDINSCLAPPCLEANPLVLKELESIFSAYYTLKKNDVVIDNLVAFAKENGDGKGKVSKRIVSESIKRVFRSKETNPKIYELRKEIDLIYVSFLEFNEKKTKFAMKEAVNHVLTRIRSQDKYYCPSSAFIKNVLHTVFNLQTVCIWQGKKRKKLFVCNGLQFLE